MNSSRIKFGKVNNPHQALKLIPLGGVGDVTKNMYVYEWENDIVIIDCGVGFPTEMMLGIDLVIPDISYLKDKKSKIRGIIITHGHEDHIGGLAYIWPELDVPIYSQKLTCGLIRAKFAEHGLPKDKIKQVDINQTLHLGAFKVEFYQVSHSVPDSTGIVLHTPVGIIIHQADFKIDWTPVNNQVTDVAKVAQLSKEGVVMMLIDCLRVEKAGYTLSERAIEGTFEKVVRETSGKVLITMTSSNITRMQQALNVAQRLGRKVALSGRSMEGNFQVARDLGYLDVPSGLMIPQQEIKRFSDKNILVLIAGAFGQLGSSLSRAANNDHKYILLKKHDSVTFSADPIPSTESAQYALIDGLTKLGCRVYYSVMTSDLHVSVLPTTEVLIRDQKGRVKLEEIQKVDNELEAYSFNRKYCTTSWKKARKVKHPYKGDIYKVTTVSGRSVEITEGHSLFALKNCNIVEVKSENLQIGDCLAIPKTIPGLENSQIIELSTNLPTNAHYSYRGNFLFHGGQCLGPKKLEINNESMRLLGYYLAEGSAPSHLSIVLHKNELDLAEEIKALIAKLLACSQRVEIRGNAQEITFGTPFLGKTFKSWFGVKATVKKVPEFIFTASEEARLNFLGAYINSEGSFDKSLKRSRIRIKTASKKLASDLLYLFSSVGIAARFDHTRENPARFVGKYQLKTSIAYVIRIQGREYLNKLLPYLSKKFQDYFGRCYAFGGRSESIQTYAPEALPVREINLMEEINPLPNTTLAQIYNELARNKSLISQDFISQKIILRDAEIIGNPLIYFISGDLLFDPIKNIEVSHYEGSVYDLSVPGPENFLGGFGGIFLHNSGHASQEEIKLMVNLAKPKSLLGIGGTYRHMEAFSQIMQEMGYSENQIISAEDGDVIEISKLGAKIVDRVGVSNVYVDGYGVGDVGNIVLRDRQVLSEDGFVVIVVAYDQQKNQVVGEPDIISRGFVYEKKAEDLLEGAKEIVKSCLRDHPGGIFDWHYGRFHIEENLEKFFYEETQRRPMILAVLVDL